MSKRRTRRDWSPPSPSGGGDAAHDEDHFAPRRRANDFVRLMRSLPDPDPILRKMGREIAVLQGLLSDSHLESAWSVRCSTVSGAAWAIAPGGEGRREREAADGFGSMLAELDMPRIIDEMTSAVAYGYSPLEVIWGSRDGRWVFTDVVGKPPQWFEFNQDNQLVFRTGIVGTEELPPDRFLIARHRPSYANPYGDKVFSKCFWPVTFKKNGFRWWTVFIEKYGGAFLYGKYPSNAGESYKTELMGALERMVSDAVAIAPEGSDITIQSVGNKGGLSGAHAGYIAAANAEISKAVLGQTLTTEIGDKGSYAAAQAHNLVREDLAAADRRRAAKLFSRLAGAYTAYNFGRDVVPPMFSFVKDEDLQYERAERDQKLHAMGWRPKKRYIASRYGMSEDDFDLAADSPAGFSKPDPDNESVQARGGGLSRLRLRFSKQEERRRARDKRLADDFTAQLLPSAQEKTDTLIDKLISPLDTAGGFDDAFEGLAAAYMAVDPQGLAVPLNEVRYAAGQIGAQHA